MRQQPDDLVQRVWTALRQIRGLAFQSTSLSLVVTGWGGAGEGEVDVVAENSESLLFIERGQWRTLERKTFGFSNTYRWTLRHGGIRMEHLRLGAARPVHLFELVADADHVCSEDHYTAALTLQGPQFRLQWRVVGPCMDETIDYRYHSEGDREAAQQLARPVSTAFATTAATPHGGIWMKAPD